MNWVCNISKEASKQILSFPKNHQNQIYSSLLEMQSDPFTGDVKPIKSGKFKDCYRKRIGKYRAIFLLDNVKKIVFIVAVLRRSDSTYS